MAKIFVDSNALAAAASLLLQLGATEVFVFGSAIRDDLRPGSDIDMAVRGLPPSVYFSAISKAADLLGRPVDLVDLDDPTPIVRYLLGSGELIRVA
jgi:predicted nucleotidyltransferase